MATPVNQITYELLYDDHRRIKQIKNQVVVGGAPSALAQYDYTFDLAGNRKQNIGTGNPTAEETIDYAYDDLHRLTQADYTVGDGSEIFRYDPLGNRDGDGTGGVYGYRDTRPAFAVDLPYGANNPANEYASIDTVAVTYDAAGNLAVDEDGLSYSYDFENHLAKITNPEQIVFATIRYDALGRRIEFTVPPASHVRRYLYDGQQELAEYDTSGAVVKYFVHGPTYIDEHVMVRDAALAQDRYYVLRELYTVAGLVDKLGHLEEAYAYDAYGLVVNSGLPGLDGLMSGPSGPGSDGFDPFPGGDDCGPDPDPGEPPPPNDPPPGDCVMLDSAFGEVQPSVNPYYFTGQRLDLLDGHYPADWSARQIDHYRARSYDPLHGRFLQRDPIGYIDGASLYEYVRSNPPTWPDPYGLQQDHHYYPKEFWKPYKTQLQPGVYDVFKEATVPLEHHSGFTHEHQLYNARACDIADKYIADLGKTSVTDLTQAEAKGLVSAIRDSQNPAIREFIDSGGAKYLGRPLPDPLPDRYAARAVAGSVPEPLPGEIAPARGMSPGLPAGTLAAAALVVLTTTNTAVAAEIPYWSRDFAGCVHCWCRSQTQVLTQAPWYNVLGSDTRAWSEAPWKYHGLVEPSKCGCLERESPQGNSWHDQGSSFGYRVLSKDYYTCIAGPKDGRPPPN